MLQKLVLNLLRSHGIFILQLLKKCVFFGSDRSTILVTIDWVRWIIAICDFKVVFLATLTFSLVLVVFLLFFTVYVARKQIIIIWYLKKRTKIKINLRTTVWSRHRPFFALCQRCDLKNAENIRILLIYKNKTKFNNKFSTYFIAVKSSSFRIITSLKRLRVIPVWLGIEKFSSTTISTNLVTRINIILHIHQYTSHVIAYLHFLKFDIFPLIHSNGTDERDMYTQSTMFARAFQANPNAISNRCPLRIVGTTFETFLKIKALF